MSVSLLYHGFGVRGYRYVNTLFHNGDIIFIVQQDPSTLRCPHCNSRLVIKRAKTWWKFRTVPIGMTTVWIHAQRVGNTWLSSLVGLTAMGLCSQNDSVFEGLFS